MAITDQNIARYLAADQMVKELVSVYNYHVEARRPKGRMGCPAYIADKFRGLDSERPWCLKDITYPGVTFMKGASWITEMRWYCNNSSIKGTFFFFF